MTVATRWRFEAADAPTQLRTASDELEVILTAHGVSGTAHLAAALVCEEVVLNALEHGGAKWVTLEIDPAKDPLVLVFEDDGGRFDPTARSNRAEAGNPGCICARGRGLILLHGFTRSIAHRFDGRNRLSVLLVE